MSDVETPQHEVRLVVGGYDIRGWQRYEIDADMLRPANAFSVTMPFSRVVWDLMREDSPVQVYIDDVQVLEGFIDERSVPEDDEVVEVNGRDRTGRLVQESAPGIRFQGMQVNELIRELAQPWFTLVTNTNARNRTILRGKGKKAKAAGEPVKLFSKKALDSLIEPGQTRWTVIQNVCTQEGLIAFSSGDGRELIVGKPNYDQEIQFRFFMPAANSKRIDESTVRGMGVRRSTADRYSMVVVVGSGTGTDVNYGERVAARYGVKKNDPATRDGDGRDFAAPKRLIVQRQVASKAEADELAAREMARRDAQGDLLTVRCAAHGQIVNGAAYPTIFAPDTLASVEDERTGVSGVYLITSCKYRSGRDGEETTMQLVRKGAELTGA